MEKKQLNLLRGVGPISEYVGFSYYQTYRALNSGEIPAKLVGGRWVASPEALDAFFKGAAA